MGFNKWCYNFLKAKLIIQFEIWPWKQVFKVMHFKEMVLLSIYSRLLFLINFIFKSFSSYLDLKLKLKKKNLSLVTFMLILFDDFLQIFSVNHFGVISK